MKYAIGIIGLIVFWALEWMDTFTLLAILVGWGLAIMWGNLFKVHRRKLIQ